MTPDRPGFTLIEMMVAFAILISAASVLFGVFGDSLFQSGEARSQAVASTIAHSVLDRVGNDLPLRDGEFNGVSTDGFPWKIIITPFGSDDDRANWSVAAHKIIVSVSWGRGSETRSILLKTLKLGPKEGAL